MNKANVIRFVENLAKGKEGHLYPAVPMGVSNRLMQQIALRHQFVKRVVGACDNFKRGKYDRSDAVKYFLDKGFTNLEVFELFEVVGL